MSKGDNNSTGKTGLQKKKDNKSVGKTGLQKKKDNKSVSKTGLQKKKNNKSTGKSFKPYYEKNTKKTLEDTKELRTRKDFSETEKIVDNGNFYSNYNVSIFYKIFWLIDGFITSLIYLLTAFVLGWVLDDYVMKPLDPKRGKFVIFWEAVGQIFYIILIFYLIIYIYGKYLPDFSFYPPPEHMFLKQYSAGFFTLFGIFAIERKLKNKLKYIFYNELPS